MITIFSKIIRVSHNKTVDKFLVVDLNSLKFIRKLFYFFDDLIYFLRKAQFIEFRYRLNILANYFMDFINFELMLISEYGLTF